MTRAILLFAFLMAVAILVQTTFIQAIDFLGVIPDISFVLLIYASVRNGSTVGQVSGFLSGIVMDLMSAAPLGFNAFVRTISGFLYGIFNGNLFIDLFIAPFLMSFGGIVLKGILTGGLSLIFRGHIQAYSFFEKTIWIEALYTATIAPVIFLILHPFRKFLVIDKDKL